MEIILIQTGVQCILRGRISKFAEAMYFRSTRWTVYRLTGSQRYPGDGATAVRKVVGSTALRP